METEKQVIDYQAVLADLESKRNELDNAISVIKRVLGEPSAATGATTGHHKSPTSHTLTQTSFFGMSIGDAAKKYLAIVKEDKSTPVIAKALQDHGIKTVSKNFTVTVFAALERKEVAGEVVRPKRGLWGLTEWYPGLRKSGNGDKKDQSERPKKTDTAQPNEANRRAVGIAGNSGVITVGAFEDFVREKPRRMKEVLAHFGVNKEIVTKLLAPESKVHMAGIGWLKVVE